MTAINETAYPRLKPNPTEQELNKNFLPTKKEIGLLNRGCMEEPPKVAGFLIRSNGLPIIACITSYFT